MSSKSKTANSKNVPPKTALVIGENMNIVKSPDTQAQIPNTTPHLVQSSPSNVAVLKSPVAPKTVVKGQQPTTIPHQPPQIDTTTPRTKPNRQTLQSSNGMQQPKVLQPSATASKGQPTMATYAIPHPQHYYVTNNLTTMASQPLTTIMLPKKAASNVNGMNINLVPVMSPTGAGGSYIVGLASPISRNDNNANKDVSDKQKPSPIPVARLQIGNWIRRSTFLGDIFCKFYFRKRRIVWEMMGEPIGFLKRISIDFANITKIEFSVTSDRLSSMVVDVSKPPVFFQEVNPQPGKAIQWLATQDFTGGQSLVCGRHIVYFAKATLLKYLPKILADDTIKKLVVNAMALPVQPSNSMETEEGEDDDDEYDGEELEFTIADPSMLYPQHVIIPQQQYVQTVPQSISQPPQ